MPFRSRSRGPAPLGDLVARAAAGLGLTAEPVTGGWTVRGGDGPAVTIDAGAVGDWLDAVAPADDALRADRLGEYLRQTVTHARRWDAPDPSAMQPLLRTSVRAREADTDGYLHRPVAPGLVEYLILDTPETMARLGVHNDRGDWPFGVDEAYAHGREAVRTREPVETAWQEGDDGLRALAVFGNPYYASTHALWPDRLVDVPERGVLLVVPARDIVLVAPVPPRVTPAIRTLFDACRSWYDDAEYPVSRDVYHWHAGRTEVAARPAEPGGPVDLVLTPAGLRLTG